MKRAAVVAAAVAALTALVFAGGGLPLPWGPGNPPAQQQAQPQQPQPGVDDYKRIAKWAVSYADMNLGMVEGKATCRWRPLTVREGISARDLPVQCELKIRNPQTGQLHVLSAPNSEIRPSDKTNPALRMKFLGQLPGDRISSPPTPPLSLTGAPGGTATITIKNGKTDSEGQVEVSGTAMPDPDQVRFVLAQDVNGGFSGDWEYTADPITERNADGRGAAGVFDTLRDEDTAAYQPREPGGFLGLQKGHIDWSPLPPTIYTVHVLEDQAAFAGVGLEYRYPYPTRDNAGPNVQDAHTRTLVIIGRDLPVIENDPVFEIESKDDALRYQIVANARAKDVSADNERLFERAWREVTLGWDAKEAEDFRKLDAVLVRVHLGNAFVSAPDPGPKHFTWGTAAATWTLQYGDNTADVSFTRIADVGPAPAAGPGAAGTAQSGTRYETVSALALPEKVFVEVRTGANLQASTIPVIVGAEGAQGLTKIPLIANRVPGENNLYRTASIVMTYAGGPHPTAGGAAAMDVGSGRVLAAVDPDKTHFLRATPAEAGRGNVGWLVRLHEALRCLRVNRNLTMDDVQRDWPRYARSPEGTVSGIDVRYGDHAAMLLLLDAFVQAERSEIAMLKAALAEAAPSDQSESQVDAWYRSVAPAVTAAPDWVLHARGVEFPLTNLQVASPAGPVPFNQAYSDDFREATFHPATTPDGQTRFVAWRRQASREAISFMLQHVSEAYDRAKAIGTGEYERCDYKALLKFTGSGFQHVDARITPLLMAGTPSGFNEPDHLARAYATNLDTLANAVEAQKALSDRQNAVVTFAASVLVPPLAGVAWGVFGSGAAAVTAWTAVVGGFAQWSYESAHNLYEKYQQYEEARFALGAYSALGLDRYFDAASRAQDWWPTGLSIAAGIGLQVAAIYPAGHTLSEEIALWRGSRFAQNLEGGLAAARALPDEAKGPLMLYLSKQQEVLHTVKAVGGEGAEAAQIFDEFSRELKGLPRRVEDPVAAALARDAAKPVEELGPTGTVVGKPDALRVAKDEIAKSQLLGEAKDGTDVPAAKAETAAVGPSPKTGTVIDVRIPKPTVVPQTAPKEPLSIPIPGDPNRKWTATIRVGGVDQTIRPDVGDLIGVDSAFFRVYRLKSADGLPQAVLDELVRAGVGVPSERNPVVMKLFRRGLKLKNFSRDFPGIDQNVVNRMMTAQERLKGTPVKYEKIAGFTGSSDIEFQGFLEKKSDELVLIEKGDFEAGQLKQVKNGGRDKSLAVLKETATLIDHDLVFLDSNLYNWVWKKKSGSSWVASILDMDMVGTVQDVSTGPYENYFKYTVFDRPGSMFWEFKRAMPSMSNARALMYDRIVMWGWLGWNKVSRQLESGYMRVEEVRQVFPEMPFLPPKKSFHWLFDFTALRDRVDLVGARPRSVLLGRPAWIAA